MTDAEVATVHSDPVRSLIQSVLPWLDDPVEIPDEPVVGVSVLPPAGGESSSEKEGAATAHPVRRPSLDPAARRAIIDANATLLARAATYVYARFPTWLTADDLEQEAWIMADRILARWCPALGRNMTPEGWMYIVLINSLIDHVRQQSRCRIKTTVVFVAELDGAAEEQVGYHHARRRSHRSQSRQRDLILDMADAQADMTPLQRDLMKLRFEEDLTMPEMVARARLPIGRIRAELVDAMQIVERYVGGSAD